ncbi:P44/Msp2 family outer membrane protein [bacterium]|nr:P44/Msp2 family outer membrane protein [bacterium]
MRRLAVLVLAAAFLLAAASPSDAARKKKEDRDPWKGRVAIGARLGGSFGGEGSAFVGQAVVTYWWIKYLSTTLASGYGYYTAFYTDADGDEQTVQVNYVPSEFLVTLYPIPGGRISPYLGPGVGVDYIWYEIEDERQSGTIYSGIGRAGILYAIAPNAGVSLGVRYTKPLNTTGDLDDQDQATIGLEAGLSIFF